MLWVVSKNSTRHNLCGRYNTVYFFFLNIYFHLFSALIQKLKFVILQNIVRKKQPRNFQHEIFKIKRRRIFSADSYVRNDALEQLNKDKQK